MSVSYTWPSLPTYFTYLASVRVRIWDPFLLYFRLRTESLLGHPGLSRAETWTVWLLTSSSAAPILSPAQVVVAALLSHCPLGLNLPLIPSTPHPTSFPKSWSTYPLSVKIFESLVKGHPLQEPLLTVHQMCSPLTQLIEHRVSPSLMEPGSALGFSSPLEIMSRLLEGPKDANLAFRNGGNEEKEVTY